MNERIKINDIKRINSIIKPFSIRLNNNIVKQTCSKLLKNVSVKLFDIKNLISTNDRNKIFSAKKILELVKKENGSILNQSNRK
jgi:hypothetical protein